MTEEQKFIFDLKGYLLIPEVLEPSEITALKTQIETIRTEPESLPLHERQFPGGTASFLIDHPVVLDVLHEILGEVRMESSWFTYRTVGNGGPTTRWCAKCESQFQLPVSRGENIFRTDASCL